jgi:hypothetical protein
MNYSPTLVSLFALLITAGLAVSLLSCGEETTEAFGFFDAYGRVVYRPAFFGSMAEFYVYSNGVAVTDAMIIVDYITIPLVDTAAGYYGGFMEISIGDTVEYSIDSEFGFLDGILVIPDTAVIINPSENDTLLFGSDITATWQRAVDADGYYTYLENQLGFVAAVTETYFDTTATLPGSSFIESGADIFWVEALNGPIVEALRPDGRRVPRGVVGAAGNFREVFVNFAR